MKLVWWMLAGSVLSSLVLTILLGLKTGFEVCLGMIGPLASAIASWIAMKREYRRKPEALTGLLIKAFAAKMIFFALYISVPISIGLVRPVPFVISFFGYFLSLHVMEATGLRQLNGAVLPASFKAD
jgi:hypothetical protein